LHSSVGHKIDQALPYRQHCRPHPQNWSQHLAAAYPMCMGSERGPLPLGVSRSGSG